MFVSTEEAARHTGLSTYELRRGFKEGRYPALLVGRGDRRKFLRWDIELLEQALKEAMMSSAQGGR